MLPPEEKKKGESEKFGKTFRESGQFLGSGIQMAAAVVIMYFVGIWIDGKFESAPWGMIVCVFFGATAGLVHFIREVNELSKKEAKKK